MLSEPFGGPGVAWSRHENGARKPEPGTWRGAAAPLVGITTDVELKGQSPAASCRMTYADAVAAAGGIPVFLSPVPRLAAQHARRCEAFVFTGGDDPRMEAFGVPTHPKATPLHPLRQEYELALLEALLERTAAPVLGICLGMQMMALHAGGMLDQHLPETRVGAAGHYDATHPIVPEQAGLGLIPPGTVWSRHRQAVIDPGRLTVAARAGDGIIEAVVDPRRTFYLGVQWHPERTEERAVGAELFRGLVAAAAASS
jgi:putative glutamine amidotransferase